MQDILKVKRAVKNMGFLLKPKQVSLDQESATFSSYRTIRVNFLLTKTQQELQRQVNVAIVINKKQLFCINKT